MVPKDGGSSSFGGLITATGGSGGLGGGGGISSAVYNIAGGISAGSSGGSGGLGGSGGTEDNAYGGKSLEEAVVFERFRVMFREDRALTVEQ